MAGVMLILDGESWPIEDVPAGALLALARRAVLSDERRAIELALNLNYLASAIVLERQNQVLAREPKNFPP
jgi:hypothetical protein